MDTTTGNSMAHFFSRLEAMGRFEPLDGDHLAVGRAARPPLRMAPRRTGRACQGGARSATDPEQGGSNQAGAALSANQTSQAEGPDE
jgi:hypothetical protein